MIKKYNGYSPQIIASKKSAFEDNLAIWNLLGHIQMASIEMKEFLKRLSVKYIDEWEQRSIIKSAYTAIRSWLMALIKSLILSNVIFQVMIIVYSHQAEKNSPLLEIIKLLN